ncbi:MAG: CAP domain-containing protein [Akkermansiaceae bacterium]|jgi:uncharacterized protein YkwD|nr:CAP domain-containing protein [Akkermansiaceae bacterium]MCU0778665.1 CAP domain-containing protein [Akkermansiaceae bacterium]
MKTKRAIPTPSLLTILGFGILASCAAPSETNRKPVAYRGDSSLTETIHQDVNRLRASHGAGDLRRHAGLDKLATEHCEFLRKNRGKFSLYGKNVSHHGAEGRAVVAMRSLEMTSFSENVAWTMTGPSHAATSHALITLWQDSPKHRDAMLEDEWTHTGVGAVVDADGSVFATQIFATKSLSLMSTRDRFNQY